MQLADVFTRLAGPASTVGFDAYDGSSAGPADATTRIVLRTPEAVGYIVGSPGELGLARAYISGQLDVEGDLHEALVALASPRLGELSLRDRLGVLRGVGRIGPALLKPRPPPREEHRISGLRHSLRRDAAAIAHHYDVSNDFYRLFLGPSMAYTCAVYDTSTTSLEDAQRAKFELVSRKLDLQPGQRLLDVGCGWGGMVMHAAEHHGVHALGVTLSRQQADWAQKAIAERGLSDRCEVRFLDYRAVGDGGFDAVSSIGLTEHIGARNLPSYFSALHAKVRPGGRLLNHSITRPSSKQPVKAGKFITRYVFPDGEIESAGAITTQMQDAGFEVRHVESLREHYALTLRDWVANLDDRWDEAVAEIGPGRARVWRLYMAASRLGFERDGVELHQVLGVRTGDTGESGFPLRPTW